MFSFFSGVPRMAGVSVARPRLVFAAVAVAAVATSACLADRLHPLVPTVSFHAASPSLLSSAPSSSAGALNSVFPCISSTVSLARRDLSVDVRSFTFLLPVQSAWKPIPLMIDSVPSITHVLSHYYPVARLCSTSATGSIFPPLSSVSLRPSYLYSILVSPRDEIPSPFKAYITMAERLSRSPRAMSLSWTLNSPSFDTSDLSFHLGSFFSSPTTSRSLPSPSVITARSLHTWHEPTISEPLSPEDDDGYIPGTKPILTVVLLGWLGSQQKHLKKYAEWYNVRGINAVTFTLPMADILSLSVGAKAEDHVEHLTNQLSSWLEGETEGQKGLERQLIFHTFSNTGWLTYGVVLEKLSSKGNWVDRIKGCVVDSAPAADLDPQIWASGFSAALLKKRSSATNEGGMRDSGIADSRHPVFVETSKPHIAESAFLTLLEKFFVVFLQIPSINNRLSQVITVLSKEQPPCPQLYIYSTADKVIPSKMVESFMEKQRQQGRIVKGFNFQSSPHVDHFRSFPEIYSNQVSSFLQECLHTSFSEQV